MKEKVLERTAGRPKTWSSSLPPAEVAIEGAACVGAVVAAFFAKLSIEARCRGIRLCPAEMDTVVVLRLLGSVEDGCFA